MRRLGIVITATVLFSLLAASQTHAALIPKLEWVQIYDRADDAYDVGLDLATDQLGKIYVVGSEVHGRSYSPSYIWVRKYAADGSTLWTNEYENPDFDKGIASGVGIDSTGNAYVIGSVRTADVTQNLDMCIRKYNFEGSVLWTEFYDSGEYGWDSGNGVALDSDDNVYCVGNADGKLWLRKYDSNNDVLWTRTYDDSANDQVASDEITVDAAGNIYVIGREQKNLGTEGYNVWLCKYDTDGNVIWWRNYDSPNHYNDYGHGIALDSEANIFIACYSSGMAIAKYNIDGNLLWSDTYPGAARDVAIDAYGNAYVTGIDYRNVPGETNNIWLRKYSNDGLLLWTEIYDGPEHGVDHAQGITLDKHGNIFVTGFANGEQDGSYGSDIILLKYAQVPEPATLLLLAPALLGFAGVVLKRRK